MHLRPLTANLATDAVTDRSAAPQRNARGARHQPTAQPRSDGANRRAGRRGVGPRSLDRGTQGADERNSVLRGRAHTAVRLAAGVVAALSLAAAPATAAPWSAPMTIPGATDGRPALAQGASGPRAVYWSSAVPVNPAAPATFVSRLGPGVRPEPAQALPGAFQLGAVGDLAAVDGRGRIVLPALTRTRANAGAVAAGALIAPRLRTLPAPVRALAVNAAGDAALVIEPWAARGYRPAAPRLVLRRHGHGFGPAVALDRKGHGHDAAVAIDRRGRVLAAWDRDGRVYARFVSAHGTLGPIQPLGTVTTISALQAVLSDDGRAAVAWTSQRVSEGDALSPFTATLALAAAHRRFAPPKTLETVRVTGFGRSVPYRGLVVRLPAGRPGLAAWTGHDGQHYVVRAAPIDGTTVGAPQTVSQPATDTVLADAAEGPRGEAVVLLLPGCAGACPGPGGLVAVTRAAGAPAFGAPEPIVPAPAFIDGADVAIEAASGLVFATWANDSAPIGWSVRAPIG
jgi:hypothetical protein